MEHHVLELYSGIGGMHCAWKESKIPGKIRAAADINTVANEVYLYNFPDIYLINRNIQSIMPKEISDLGVDTILMSPPCQPFSRNGKYLDENDPRTNSFLYILSILPELNKVNYILMENVKGFETSSVRNLFIQKLKECNFLYQEFLINPISIGVPNSRLRYYCIAKKNDLQWEFKRKDEIIEMLPQNYGTPFPLNNIIEENVSEQYLIPDKFLKWANIFDICFRDSTRSCCFTKAYTHYNEGTGSLFTEVSQETVKQCLENANKFDPGTDEFNEIVKELKLRYFTPIEVLALMCFPKSYKLPSSITRKQCYRLLGNSVNVKVISELLKILFDQ